MDAKQKKIVAVFVFVLGCLAAGLVFVGCFLVCLFVFVLVCALSTKSYLFLGGCIYGERFSNILCLFNGICLCVL